MSRIWILRERTCKTCNGEGVVSFSDFWTEYYEQKLKNRELDPDEFAREKLGWDYAPDLEMRCWDCAGEGKVREEVPLDVALREPAVLKAVAEAVAEARAQAELEVTL